MFLQTRPECLVDLLGVDASLDGAYTYCVSFSEEDKNEIYIGPANDMDRTYPRILPLLDTRKLTGVCKKSEIPFRG